MSNALGTKLTFSPVLADKLKNDYGFEATAESLNERFLNIIERHRDMPFATNETWSKAILPKDFKALFNDLKNEILPKAAAKGFTPEESMMKVESAIADIGKLIEDFSENLANYDDVEFFEKPLSLNPDQERDPLFKRQHLIEKKEIERLKIAHATIRYPGADTKENLLVKRVCSNLCKELELPDTENGTRRLPYVFGEHHLEDEARFYDSAHQIRDAIKAHQSRGFFYKLFYRARYNNEQHEIDTATQLLKSCYDPERVDRILDTKELPFDISEEERSRYGANKNAEQIAREIEQKAAEEVRQSNLEREKIEAMEKVKKVISEATLEEIKSYEMQVELEKYDDLFQFAESIEIPPEEEKVGPQMDKQDSEMQEQQAVPDAEEKPQAPDDEASKSSGGVISGLVNIVSSAYNGTKYVASAVINTAKNVTYAAVDQVNYAGKLAYQIGAGGYHVIANATDYIYTTATDYYTAPRGFDKEKFDTFRRNEKFKELPGEKHSDELSSFMQKCYSSKLRIASTLEDVTQQDIANAAAFDVIKVLQDGFADNTMIRAQLYTKIKLGFENNPKLTEAAILKDIQNKAAAYDDKKRKMDPSACSILDVNYVRTELDRKADFCFTLSTEVLFGYFTARQAAKKTQVKDLNSTKVNDQDRPVVEAPVPGSGV